MDITPILFVVAMVVSMVIGTILGFIGSPFVTFATGVALVHAMACGAAVIRESGGKRDPSWFIVLVAAGAVSCATTYHSIEWVPLVWLPSFFLGMFLTPPATCDEYGQPHYFFSPRVAQSVRGVMWAILACYAVYSLVCSSSFFPSLPAELWGRSALFPFWLPLLSVALLWVCWRVKPVESEAELTIQWP